MVSLSFPGGRPLFLVLALVLVCLSLCVPHVVGDFGFNNWSPPFASQTLQSSSGTPTGVEFQGKIHIVFRAASALYYVSSTDGYHFAPVQQLEGYLTSTEPYLVVVTDQSTKTQSLVLLFGSGSQRNRLFYSTYTGQGLFPFNTPQDTNQVSDLFGDIDAAYAPSYQQLVAVYVTSQCAYASTCNPDTDYYNVKHLSATLNNGVWSWNGASTISNAAWRLESEAALFSTADYTYLSQLGGSTGYIFNYDGSSFTVINKILGSNLALDASYSGVAAATFTNPPLVCGQWTAIFFIDHSNTNLAYSLLGQGSSYDQPHISSRTVIGFNDGENINLPRQPVGVYFSVTNAMYVYYLDFSSQYARIESINSTFSTFH